MRTMVAWILGLGLFLGAFQPAWATTALSDDQDASRYVVEDLQGDATVTRAGQRVQPLKEGDALGQGDEVVLGSDAQAVLMLNEDTSLQLGPDSRLTVDFLEVDAKGGFSSHLKLWGGRLLCQVRKLLEKESRFEVSSGGVVCGVRGTQFEVEALGEDVETRTLEGEVDVTSQGRSERVKAGHVVAHRKGLLRAHRRLDRSEIARFTQWKDHHKKVREKRLKRVEHKLRQLKKAGKKADQRPVKRRLERRR